jgi:hypothetical protein
MKNQKNKETYTWKRIKSEYLKTNISLREIAEKYKISLSSLSCRSRKENWVNEKKKTQKELEEKCLQKAINREVKRRVTEFTKNKDFVSIVEFLLEIIQSLAIKIKELELKHDCNNSKGLV